MPTESGLVAVRSDEATATLGPDLELCYQTFGDPDPASGAEPLLLAMGLGGPMLWWDDALCEQLADAGFFVIRYDNRDTGRSSRAKGRVTRSMIIRAFVGLPVAAPYTLSDLADDGLALLDALGIESAHLAGVSMGGMIVQTMALAHPERVRSLTSIESTTGRRTVGWVDPTLAPQLLGKGALTRDEYVAQARLTWKRIGSPGYPEPPEVGDARAGATFDRGISKAGVLRQMLAVLSQPDRTAGLRRLDVPTLVIHGDRDRMVHPTGGRATANAVPGARMLLVKGMGHDLPQQLFTTFVAAIRSNADRAKTPASA